MLERSDKMLILPLSWKALTFYRRIESIFCEAVYKNLQYADIWV